MSGNDGIFFLAKENALTFNFSRFVPLLAAELTQRNLTEHFFALDRAWPRRVESLLSLKGGSLRVLLESHAAQNARR